MTSKKVWQDTQGDSTDQCTHVPSGSGERSTLLHVGSASFGLLEDCMLLYRGNNANKLADYHTEMCWDVFSDWCERKVFPAMAKQKTKAVLIVDQATYHTKLDDDDRKPTTSWNKTRISNAIKRWSGPGEGWMDGWLGKNENKSPNT